MLSCLLSILAVLSEALFKGHGTHLAGHHGSHVARLMFSQFSPTSDMLYCVISVAQKRFSIFCDVSIIDPSLTYTKSIDVQMCGGCVCVCVAGEKLVCHL